MPMIRVFIFCAAVIPLGCSSFGGSKEGVHRLEGMIYVTGNAPFTKLALQGDDGVRYFLKCTKEVEEVLNRSQGRRFTVHYSAMEKGPEGPILKVVSAEPAREENDSRRHP
jgi:hypothetical protein